MPAIRQAAAAAVSADDISDEVVTRTGLHTDIHFKTQLINVGHLTYKPVK